MALMPKRVKYRKQQRGKIRGIASRGEKVAFGEFGLQSIEPAWLQARTIEAGRVTCTRNAPEAKVFIRVFPDKPVTSTPAETRMGKGKGEPEFWVARIKPGTIVFELGGVSEDVAKLTFNRLSHKLPFRTRMVKRRHM